MRVGNDLDEKELTPYAKTVAVGPGIAVFSANRCVRVVGTFVSLAQKLLLPVRLNRCHKVRKLQDIGHTVNTGMSIQTQKQKGGCPTPAIAGGGARESQKIF